MGELKERPLKSAAGETFTLDRAYVKAQAKEGLSTFFAPFTGVMNAVAGPFAAKVKAMPLKHAHQRALEIKARKRAAKRRAAKQKAT